MLQRLFFFLFCFELSSTWLFTSFTLRTISWKICREKFWKLIFNQNKSINLFHIDVAFSRSLNKQHITTISFCQCFSFFFTDHSLLLEITFVANHNYWGQLACSISILVANFSSNFLSLHHVPTLTLVTFSNLSSTSARLPLSVNSHAIIYDVKDCNLLVYDRVDKHEPVHVFVVLVSHTNKPILVVFAMSL